MSARRSHTFKGMRNGIIMALVAAFALGAGVMGTLVWVENQPAQSAPVPASAAAPVAAPPQIDAMAAADAAARAKAAASAGGDESAPPQAASGATSSNVVEQPPVGLTQGKTGPEATLAVANWYYDHERWPQAIELYRSTVSNGIDNANVRTDLGNALRFGGKPEEALTQYQIAQRDDPSHEQSLFNQGGLYAFALGDTKKAVVAWKAYLKKFPKGHSAADARGFIAKYEGKKRK